jgi:hypothetical protein
MWRFVNDDTQPGDKMRHAEFSAGLLALTQQTSFQGGENLGCGILSDV